MIRVPMTVVGHDLLRKELEQLKFVDRPRITQAISEAREHGDLKENAEYHAAREQQSFVEGRIQELEDKLSNAEVIDVTKLSTQDKVVFGATVHICPSEDDAIKAYQIVGEDEADIKVNKISVTSPMARALIGKEVGELVQVQTPNGAVEYEITDIAYL